MKKITAILFLLFSLCANAQIEVKMTRDTRLLDSISIAFGKDLAVIPPGESVRIIDYFNDWFTAKYKEQDGYIYYPYFSDINSVQLEQFKQEHQRSNTIKRLTAIYGKDLASKIYYKEIWIGMTAREARLTVGDPKSINSTTSAGSESQQWVYPNRYLYFDNGKLTTIQESK